MKASYDTLSEAMNALTKEGYTLDFNLKSDCIYSRDKELSLSPNEFKIDRVFRFEGMTNPGDSSILFAISGINEPVKGTLVDAYGAYSDRLNDDMIKKLQMDV
jgi:hypothetical protein